MVWKRSREIRFLLFEILSLLIFCSTYLFYVQAKSSAIGVADREYNKFFLDNMHDIGQNINFFFLKLTNSLLFRNHVPFENFFNWFLIVLSAAIVVAQIKNKRKNIFIQSLLIVCIVSVTALFLSRWNFRSEFSPGYFTPVYVIFCFMLLLFLDSDLYRNWPKLLDSAAFLFFGIRYCYGCVIITKNNKPF